MRLRSAFLALLLGACSSYQTDPPADPGSLNADGGSRRDGSISPENDGGAPDAVSPRGYDLMGLVLRCTNPSAGYTGAAEFSLHKVAFAMGSTPSVASVQAVSGADYDVCDVYGDPAGGFILRPSRTGGAFNAMARYQISPGTGALLGPTMLPFGQATVSANPSTGAMHPGGKFMVLTTATHEVVSLRIDAAAMTEIGRAPTESPFTNTPWLAFHPNGKFLYLTSVRDASMPGVKSGIVIYSFDAATGAIRVIGHYDNASGIPSFRLLVRPAGDFLITAEAQEIVSLRIDPVTGALGQRQALSTTNVGSFPVPQAFLDETTFITSPVAGSPAIQSSRPVQLNLGTGALTMGTAFSATFSGPQVNDGITYSVADGHAAAAVGTNAVFFDWDAAAKKPGPAAQVAGALRVHHVELLKVPR